MSLVAATPTKRRCRLWRGNSDAYGSFKIGGERFAAHRLSYVFFVGPIPDDLHVLHKCDVPGCVNPAHLFLGTEADNHADMKAKGRAAKGVRNGSARITESTVMAIFSAKGTHVEIGRIFGVHKATVSHIKTGRQWSSVTGKIFSPAGRARMTSQAASV